ncbi:MAG: hypothetical protein ACK41T_11425 [Pseudobdellovibrio sp.]
MKNQNKKKINISYVKTVFSEENLADLKKQLKSRATSLLKEMPAQDKEDVISWIQEIIEIKKNKNFTRQEMRKQIKKVKTTDAVLHLIKSLVGVLIYKIPLENKTALNLGAKGAGLAISLVSLRFSGAALIVLKQVLPRLLMSDKFDDLANFLITNLDKIKKPTRKKKRKEYI